MSDGGLDTSSSGWACAGGVSSVSSCSGAECDRFSSAGLDRSSVKIRDNRGRSTRDARAHARTPSSAAIPPARVAPCRVMRAIRSMMPLTSRTGLRKRSLDGLRSGDDPLSIRIRFPVSGMASTPKATRFAHARQGVRFWEQDGSDHKHRCAETL
jgi:hypothetical protein